MALVFVIDRVLKSSLVGTSKVHSLPKMDVTALSTESVDRTHTKRLSDAIDDARLSRFLSLLGLLVFVGSDDNAVWAILDAQLGSMDRELSVCK
jgi:hypothetical protein